MPKTFIIAEAGVNHNGSEELALRLVDVAATSGADAVKFQTFRSEALISHFAAKADYQKATTGSAENQLEMVRKLELTPAVHRAVLTRCRERGIRFMSTPFDAGSADFLIREMGLDVVKIPSGEITHAPFLLHLAKLGKPVILSTGMSTLGEVELALGVLAFGYLGRVGPPSEQTFRDAFAHDDGQHVLAGNVSLLHCTTEYPAPYDQVNLRAMDTLASAFGLPVGLSDHTPGIAMPVAAVARGAVIIEKHFTLDRNLPGPDHRASLEPAELAAMVVAIRHVEQALGSPVKRPSPAEWANRNIARRSLVAARAIKAGEAWSEVNLVCKRPAGGMSPFGYWAKLGHIADRDYEEDDFAD